MTRRQAPSIFHALRSGTQRHLEGINPLRLQQKGTHAKALIALSVVCFLWGTTWLASKEGVRHMPALQLAGIRQLIGGSIYLIYFLIRGAALPRLKELGPLLVLALLNFVFSNGLSTWGVKFISAGLASIIGAIFPLWIVVIGLFRGSERIPLKAIAGLVLGFAGVCIIFYEHLEDFLVPDFRLGIALSLIATWTWALGSLYTKQQAAKFNPYFGLGFQMVLAGALLLGISNFDPNYLPLQNIPTASWLSIAYLVIFGSLFAFVAYLYALQHLPTEQASIYAYVNPIIAVLLGAILFEEKLTALLMLGGLVTLYGVYLVNKAYKKISIAATAAENT